MYLAREAGQWLVTGIDLGGVPGMVLASAPTKNAADAGKAR